MSPIVYSGLWMFGAILSFSLIAVAGRELSQDLNTFQILFFRSVVSFLIICSVLQLRGWQQIRTTAFGGHVFRNVAHFVGQYGWFFGIAYLPLAEVFALEFTVPIWTLLVAAIMLGEKITPAKIIALVMGVLGVIVILRPGISVIQPAAVAVLVGAIAYGFSHTMTKKLSVRETPLAIVFYMSLIQMPLGMIPALASWQWPQAFAWIWLVLVGGLGLTAHYCMARALALADASVVVPLDYLRLPLIALVGFIFYEETLSGFVLLGALMMFAGNFISLRAEVRKRQI